MRRATAAALLTAVLVSSLPCDLAGLFQVADDTAQVTVFADSSGPGTPQDAPPVPDECICLCSGCPGSAVEALSAFATPSSALNLSTASVAPPDQTHTSDVLSRLFRPPRSA